MKKNDPVAEYRNHIAEALTLETDLIGQLVLKNYEDVQSDWSFTVDELAAWMYQQMLEARIDEQQRSEACFVSKTNEVVIAVDTDDGGVQNQQDRIAALQSQQQQIQKERPV